jgi:hypothetical protein
MDSTTEKCLTIIFWSLNNASQSNDYKMLDDLVESLNGFQKKFDKVRPSEDKLLLKYYTTI